MIIKKNATNILIVLLLLNGLFFFVDSFLSFISHGQDKIGVIALFLNTIFSAIWFFSGFKIWKQKTEGYWITILNSVFAIVLIISTFISNYNLNNQVQRLKLDLPRRPLLTSDLIFWFFEFLVIIGFTVVLYKTSKGSGPGNPETDR